MALFKEDRIQRQSHDEGKTKRPIVMDSSWTMVSSVSTFFYFFFLSHPW